MCLNGVPPKLVHVFERSAPQTGITQPKPFVMGRQLSQHTTQGWQSSEVKLVIPACLSQGGSTLCLSVCLRLCLTEMTLHVCVEK